MRKAIVLLAACALVAAFAITASAAEWNLYGSARMETYWVESDFGKDSSSYAITGTGTQFDSDSDLQWDNAVNSRIGANVKNDMLEAQFEFGVDGNGGGGNVGTRRLYGVWDFGAGKLKVGKDYTPFKVFNSGQGFDASNGLLGRGAYYGARRPQISFMFGGFEIALIQPTSAALQSITVPTAAATPQDVDEYLPKIEAMYGMSTDALNWKVVLGYQTYDIERPSGTPGGDLSVDSYALGADVTFNVGPIRLSGAFAYMQNPGSAGWLVLSERDDTFTPGGTVNDFRSTGTAVLNAAGNDVADVDTIMWDFIAGFAASETLSFEAGLGYVSNDIDQIADKDDYLEYYVQAVMTLAPGVYIIPELGLRDYGDTPTGPNTSVDSGDDFYLGAKWQIDF
jgi:hypothetical protein